ncbi:maltotransferase domain-containing protein [Rhizobium sp. SIMBA_035]
MMPARRSKSVRPRIYYVNPLDLPTERRWLEVFDHAASLNFDTVMTAPIFRRKFKDASIFNAFDTNSIDPAFGPQVQLEEGIAFLCERAKSHGIGFMMDVVPRAGQAGSTGETGALDPRLSPSDPVRNAPARGDIDHINDLVLKLSTLGVSGFRYLGLDTLGEVDLKRLAGADMSGADPLRLVYTPGTDFSFRRRLAGLGFSGTFSSLAWWDLREAWFFEELHLQRAVGLQIAFPEAPFARRLAHGTESREIRERKSIRALRLSAELGDGMLIPMGFEFGAVLPLDATRGSGQDLRMMRSDGAFDVSAAVREANAAIAAKDALTPTAYEAASQVIVISLSDAPDPRVADRKSLLVVNRDLRRPCACPEDIISRAAAPFLVSEPHLRSKLLAAGEVRVVTAAAGAVIATQSLTPPGLATEASERIAIENIQPSVDLGRFPVKRVVGDRVDVTADIFADGHDRLEAAILYRALDEAEWHEVPLSLDGNDRWAGAFRLERIGRYYFCIEAWKNPFAIFRYEFSKKAEARLDLSLELIEGAALVRRAAERTAGNVDLGIHHKLVELLKVLEHNDGAERARLLLGADLSVLMSQADERPFRTRSGTFSVESERAEAAFSSWYQVFPRSQSGDPHRHGTFDDVVARLPAIREMGFDVLYFPPIHPIGSTNRKGRNNSLVAGPGDPGSPYAIGSADGGHDAIHPELGGLDAFRRLVEAMRNEGLELALDLAIQASPDHPWLTEHPGWFEWRPDGTIRYAENPPKRYEDIVNVDFYSQDAVPALWEELRDIVQLWVDEGVKLFRVDNPHTKPFPFWEWLIGDIRGRHPEVVFLSEAFTRPKVMYRLAKVGFSQSYTYFTWRNSKWELEQYMLEITQSEAKEFFRPHFFVNTHDINPDFLQNASRPAFVIRAALAATLSGLWGVYNGFELCEGRPDVKRKEYADSEKYEIRAWDYDRPGNIKPEITMLNRLRRDNPALHSHLGLTFLNSSNPNVMFFEKAAPGRHNVLLIGICLNPHGIEESTVEIPLWNFGKADGGTLDLEDLVSPRRFSLTGKWQTLRLDPIHLPFAIWRVRTGEI